MTGEGFIDVFNDPELHNYIIDFTKNNIKGEDRQGRFIKDIWCDIGILKHEEPSLNCIVNIVWRRMIKYEPILKKLSEGYTQSEIADELCKDQSNISRKLRHLMHKNC